MRKRLGYALSILTILGIILSGVFIFQVPPGWFDQFINSAYGETVLLVSSVCGAILWIWMTTSFFRHRGCPSPAYWGWFLFIGNVIAAVPYFVFVYLRSGADD